ncbi:hypothetical protein ACFW5D_04170 [Streptomyces sp. NPDC058770]|uniref:hypothetical protein n=1 Tax=Streptomyces sp. NPDC058770 TaxID=3346631 RepID=UPI003698B30E
MTRHTRRTQHTHHEQPTPCTALARHTRLTSPAQDMHRTRRTHDTRPIRKGR